MSPLAFTCLLPVWAGDTAEAFLQAAHSVESSTLAPDEILICQDGPLPRDLARAVEALQRSPTYRLVVNQGPRGLHHNLNRAVLSVQTRWIARMDADDINQPGRFAAQVAFLAANPEVDVLGGAILEIAPDGASRRRVTPLTHDGIIRRARWRSPMNHMTVFMRRDAFLSAGGYPDIARKEDYALWLQMIARGAIFANLPEDLVGVRLGRGFVGRRAGLANLSSEYRLCALRRRLPRLGGPQAAAAFAARAVALSSPTLAALLYRSVLRRGAQWIAESDNAANQPVTSSRRSPG
jgi:glycosyltransferase involved in cell wall biosynthesis